MTEFKPGDEVYGTCDGSFAEYVRAQVGLLALKPANLSFEQAAAVPVSGVTALQGVRDRAQVKPEEKVLIIGASGGVGTFAVQIAKSYYEEKGYAVEVKGKPYDLRCTRNDAQIFVEVKGTQTPGEEVLLTPGEVTFARQNKTEMALLVVHGITVDKQADPPSASGGTTRLCEPWDIDCGELEPLGYSFKPPRP